MQAAAPVVDENSIRAQVLAEQKARVNGINDLFAMFGGRYQTLQAQCLADPECSLEQAREKLLNEMGLIFMPVTVILWGTGPARR